MLDVWSAAEAGDLDRVREFIESDPPLINAKDDFDCTPLIRATWGGHLDVVIWLIKRGANLNAQNGRRRTALREAMASHSLSIAEALLRAGADPNLPDDDGTTPLHSATSMGYRGRIDKLYTPEAHAVTDVPEDPDNSERSLAVARLLLKCGADVNARAEFDATPLHWAAGWGHEALVDLLLAHGADVNAKEIGGRTPLGEARHMGKENVVRLLKKHGGGE
jgi:ankyrin repeat protein